MKEEWSEGGHRLIHLPEDDPDTFLLYLHWLYTNALPIRIDEPDFVGNAEYVQLAKAYVLGDKLQDDAFQDVAIDMIVDKCRSVATDGHKWHPVGEAVQYIYENTLEASKARCLLVDIYVTRGLGHWISDWMKSDEIPRDFLRDLTMSFLNKRNNDPLIKTSLCEYHQHGSEMDRCYTNRFTEPKGQESVLKSDEIE